MSDFILVPGSSGLPDFELARHPVTIGEWNHFVEAGYGVVANPPLVGLGANADLVDGWHPEWAKFLPSVQEAKEGDINLPVTEVSWYEAMAYAVWAGARLPTEAEWEWAAKGGDEGRLYPWGNEEPTEEHAVFYPHAKGIDPVGGRPKGRARWGHEDMSGNVWEWSSSLFRDGEIWRVLRGGSWSNLVNSLRAAYRFFLTPTNRYDDVGFRCARSIEYVRPSRYDEL